MNSKDLAIVIATKNNMRTIEETLNSVESLGDYLLIVDSGSTDGTIELCQRKGAEIIHKDWPGMVRQRQFCLDVCKDYRWILVLDSDESLDQELRESIESVVKQSDANYNGYAFNRKVWFMGGWLHHVFQPEFRLRIVRGGVGKVEGVGPEGKGGHDRIEVAGQIGQLSGLCKHDSWADAEDMMKRYVDLGQRAALYDPKPSSFMKLFLSPVAAFIKQYFLKGGFKDGRRGLIAVAGVAGGNFIKQLLKMARF